MGRIDETEAEAKREFVTRLGDSWADVADLVGVPAYDRRRFAPGNEARDLWGWLDERRELGRLPVALVRAGRDDLAVLWAARRQPRSAPNRSMVFLLDASAYARLTWDPAARQVVHTLARTGQLALCAAVELEILRTARSVREHQHHQAVLRELRAGWLDTTDDALIAAVGLQRAMLGVGLHRPSPADLVIAGVARAHDAVLVHSNDSFDDIAMLAPDLRTRRLGADRATAYPR